MRVRLSWLPPGRPGNPARPIPLVSTPPFVHKTSLLRAFLVTLTVIILPNPLETVICGAFLNIRLSKRHVLTVENHPTPIFILHPKNRPLKRG